MVTIPYLVLTEEEVDGLSYAAFERIVSGRVIISAVPQTDLGSIISTKVRLLVKSFPSEYGPVDLAVRGTECLVGARFDGESDEAEDFRICRALNYQLVNLRTQVCYFLF